MKTSRYIFESNPHFRYFCFTTDLALAYHLLVFFASDSFQKVVTLWRFMLKFSKMNGENRGLDTNVHSCIVLPSPGSLPQLHQQQQQLLYFNSARCDKMLSVHSVLYVLFSCFRCFHPRLFRRGEARMGQRLGCVSDRTSPFCTSFLAQYGGVGCVKR